MVFMSDTINYKQLGTVVKRQGFLYRQRLRNGEWAIYEQFRKEPERSLGFEVIRIGRHNGFSRVINGVELYFPPAETYPTSSMWGRSAWTLTDYDAAVAKMKKEMLERAGIEADIIDDSALITEMLREAKSEDSPHGESVAIGE